MITDAIDRHEIENPNNAFETWGGDYEGEWTPLVSIPLVITVVALPFFWVNLPGTGVSILTVSILLFFLLGFWRPLELIKNSVRFFQVATTFHACYVAYLGILIATFLILKDFDSGWNTTRQTVMLFALYLMLGCRLLSTSVPTIKRSVLIGSGIGVVLFLVYCQIVFQSLGTNLVSAIATALQGDGGQVAAKTVKTIVNYSGGGNVTTDAELALGGSLRNTLASGLSIYFFCALASIVSTRITHWRNVLVLLNLVFIPTILLILMSRSNLIALVIGMLLAFGLMIISPDASGKIKSWLIFVFFAAAVSLFGFVWVTQELSQSDLVSANLDRFTQMTEDPRVQNYLEVIKNLKLNAIIGRGPGAKLSDGLTIHNFFLAGWYECGIFGIVICVAFFVAMSWAWIANSFRQLFHSHAPLIQVVFFAALMFGPVFRRLVSGNGGRFSVVEIVAVALFFAVVARPQNTELQTASEDSDAFLDHDPDADEPDYPNDFDYPEGIDELDDQEGHGYR